ncbi:hypothetical protein G5B35_09695 [Parapusillimonas sp. SGNA-6]|nr:hypothetical protein [Parapusillimonas sp. SGNA-6]
MNTPTISPVLPVAGNPVARAPQGNADSDTTPASFSQVLGQQHAAQGTAHKPAAPADTKPEQPAKLAGQTKPDTADDEALAVAAAEQGLSLAQIALGIAAEVAAVQAPAGHLQGRGARASGEQGVKDRPAPTTLAAALPIDTSATESAALRAATAQGPVGQAQPAAADVKPAPLDTLSALAAGMQPAVEATTAPRARATAGDALRIKVPGTAAKAAPGGLTPTAQGAEPGHSKAVADFTAAMTVAAGSTAASNPAATADAAGALAGALSAAAASATSTATPAVSVPPSGAPTLAPLIATPLQSPLWAADFSRQFVSITQAGHNMPHTAELRLDPPDLGPLRIALQITDNVAHATFISPHATVRQTVENALPQLQELLAQAGISLGQTSVSDQGQPDQAGQHGNEFTGRSGSAMASVAATETGNAPLHAATRARAPDALVDTFA